MKAERFQASAAVSLLAEVMLDLAYILGILRNRGLAGLAIVLDQDRKYVAAALDREQKICEPRTWFPQDTPDAAVFMLAEQLRRPAKKLIVEEMGK